MNKQEQIEKMVRMICEDDTPYGDEEDKVNCNECPCYKNKQCELYQREATSFVEAGYINGADFVEWLKKEIKEAEFLEGKKVRTKMLVDKALQEYLKGE